MRKFRSQPPYTSQGKTNFLYTNKKSGVYLIYKNGVLRYVGMSASNVYKTMYRHFQSWEDPSQIRIVYKNLKGFTCRVVLCTPSQATRLEKALIVKKKPKDNPQRYTTIKIDKKVIADFIGTPSETCPF